MGLVTHAENIDVLLERLGASSSDGLSSAEPTRRLEEYGPNKLPEQEKDPDWLRLLQQFRDPLVLTLLAAAFFLERHLSVEWTSRAVFSLSYLTVFGTVTAFGLYWWLLRYGSAGRLSLVAYVVPVLALFIGRLAGERVLDKRKR